MYGMHKMSTRPDIENNCQSTTLTIDCFLKAYDMLTGFVEFLECRGFNYCPIYYKKIPLQGALDIANKIMTPNIYENLPKQIIERSDSFIECFQDTCYTKSIDIPENILKKLEIVIKYLTKSLTTENYSRQIASISYMLNGLPCTSVFKKLQILCVLLKTAPETAKCCEQKFNGTLVQKKILLHLINNFIHEWRETSCETRSHFKICKFCDSIINDEIRRYVKKFCCNEAEYLDRLLKEWICLHIPPDYSSFIFGNSSDSEYQINCIKESTRGNQVFPKASNIEDSYKNHIVTQKKVSSKTRMNGISNTGNVVDSRKIKHLDESGNEMGHRDGIADKDLSKSNGNRSLRRGKIEVSRDGARNERRTRNTDTLAERIREERDNNPYQRKLGAEEDKGQQDRRPVQRDTKEETNGSRAAAGKRRRGRNTEDTTANENRGEEDHGGSSYRNRRQKVRETRSPDNHVRKRKEDPIRLDQVEEDSIAEIPGKLAKRPGLKPGYQDGQRDRRENEEKPITRPDRKEAKEDKYEEEKMAPLSKNKEPRIGSKKTMDDAGRVYSVVNEEGKVAGDDGKRKNAWHSEKYDSDMKRKWKANPASLIEYQLSNVHFVKLGWTQLPITKIMKKIMQYEVKPAKPYLDWFKKHRHKGTEYYDDGLTPFLRFHPDGSGELFYPNGILAVRVYRPVNRKYDMYTVFTPGGKDTFGVERQSQVLAIFDSEGNGVVFDEDGVARLSYNQIGGIFTDNPTGLPLVWTWNTTPHESILETTYTENLIGHLQMELFSATSKFVKSSGNVKTPISPSTSRNKEKKVELQKPVVEKRQEEVKTKLNFNHFLPEENIFHIKVICMKLNEFLSLRIIDRRNIILRFSAKNKSIRIQLGTVVNFNNKVATCVVEVNNWKSDMLRCRFQDKLATKLNSESSLYDLAEKYQKLRRFAKKRKIMINKYRPRFKIDHHNSIQKGVCKLTNNFEKR